MEELVGVYEPWNFHTLEESQLCLIKIIRIGHVAAVALRPLTSAPFQ